MTRRNGRGFSSAEKTELWDRWQRGESLKAIGRVFGKPSSSIYFQLSPHGGIRPSPRRRSRLALSLWEREEISRGIVARHSIRSMALLLSRSPSTVSREVRRNGGYDQYRAALADDMAWARARRPKRCKLALSSGMRRVVAMKLGLNWSPEQIAGWLKRAHPGARSVRRRKVRAAKLIADGLWVDLRRGKYDPIRQLRVGTPDADPVSWLPAGPTLAFAAGLAGVGSPRAPGSSRQRCGRCTGLDGVLCALRGGRSTQRPLRAVDDGQGADLCLRDGHILLARGGEEAGGGCRVSDARGGQLPATSHGM